VSLWQKSAPSKKQKERSRGPYPHPGKNWSTRRKSEEKGLGGGPLTQGFCDAKTSEGGLQSRKTRPHGWLERSKGRRKGREMVLLLGRAPNLTKKTVFQHVKKKKQEGTKKDVRGRKKAQAGPRERGGEPGRWGGEKRGDSNRGKGKELNFRKKGMKLSEQDRSLPEKSKETIWGTRGRPRMRVTGGVWKNDRGEHFPRQREKSVKGGGGKPRNAGGAKREKKKITFRERGRQVRQFRRGGEGKSFPDVVKRSQQWQKGKIGVSG